MRVRIQHRRASAAGFTLIEASLTLIIIGVGVLAMVDAQRAFIQSNLWSSHAATGTYLAQEIREFSRSLPRHDPVRGLAPDSDGVIAFGSEPGEITLDDVDDLDDLDGMLFGADGDMDGPIDATGAVVPSIALDGSIETDGNGEPIPMIGWSQEVIVEKVEPFDTALVRADDYWREVDAGGLPPLDVDRFPVRVTVIVTFTPTGGEVMEMARMTWIVP